MSTTMIPLEKINIHAGNRESIDEAKLAGLAETLRQRGQLSPVLVKRAAKGRFDLVAGERRLRAAKMLGWQEIEAKELQLADGDNTAAAEVRLIENLQRVDLTPWEEASQLRDSGLTFESAEEIALKLGRTPHWVASRLAICTLIPELRDLIEEQDWPLGHIPLLARLPVEMQSVILAEIREMQQIDWLYYDSEKERHVPTFPPLHELEGFLGEYQRLLVAAPWNRDDSKLLPQAGACSGCRKRSSAQILLFPEFDDPKKDRCLDEGCWKAKQAALVAVGIEKLQKSGTPPILLTNGSYDKVSEETAQAIGPAKFESRRDYQECKKNDPAAVPAIFVTGEDAGKVKYVKPRDSGNNRPAKSANADGEKAEPTIADRQSALRLKRQCHACELWKAKLETLKPKWAGCLDWLLIYFGTSENSKIRNEREWADFATTKANLSVDGWTQLYPVFQSRLHRFGPMEQGAEIWKEATAQARALGMTQILEFCWKDAVIDVPLTKALIKAGVADETAVPA